MQAQIALATVPALAQGAQPFQAARSPAPARRAAHGQAQDVLVIDVPQQPGLAPAHVVLDAGVVVVLGAFGHALPGFQVQLPAAAPFGPGHHIPTVPAARQGVALAVGLVYQPHAAVAPAPAPGQRGIGGIDVEHLRLMVGRAKRPRNASVEQLPIRLLGVAKPQRILAAGARAGEQPLGDFGAGRDLDAHFMALVILGQRRPPAGRKRLAIDPAALHHGNAQRPVAAQAEGAAVRAGFQLEVAGDFAVPCIAAAPVGGRGGQWQRRGYCQATSGSGIGSASGSGRHGGTTGRSLGGKATPLGGRGRREGLLLLRPGIKARQAGLIHLGILQFLYR